jgi:hypothetical protein
MQAMIFIVILYLLAQLGNISHRGRTWTKAGTILDIVASPELIVV